MTAMPQEQNILKYCNKDPNFQKKEDLKDVFKDPRKVALPNSDRHNTTSNFLS